MKRVCCVLGALVLFTVLTPLMLSAQGTAFTYQGRMSDGANPASGIYDFRFRLASDPFANNYVGGNSFTNGVPISNGLFTATIDFGGVFNGSNYWLEIGVRTNGGSSYTALAPLQALTPTPYAIFAGGASNVLGVVPNGGLSGSYSGAVSFNNAANSFSGNGGGLTNLNAALFGGLDANQFWKTVGNAGTTAGTSFLGTSDNQPLELKINGTRALRMEPFTNGAPNMIGGAANNFVDPGFFGAAIGGGGIVFSLNSPNPQHVAANFGTISGGRGNTVAGDYGAIGGGYGNVIRSNAALAVISGGQNNFIDAHGTFSFIGGGFGNTNGEIASFIGGGQNNFIQPLADHAFIGGGQNNNIAGAVGSVYSVIVGGINNTIRTNAGYGFIGGGQQNTIQTNVLYGFIGGGAQNTIQSNAIYGFIGGGQGNAILTNSPNTAIVGGYFNFAAGPYSFIGGGQYNSVQTNSYFGTVSGGAYNTIAFNSSSTTIGGGYYNLINSNSTDCAIGGGSYNNITTSPYSVISGGQFNTISNSANDATVGGGYHNVAAASYAAVPGGNQNQATGYCSFAAGQFAQANHAGSFVWADTSLPSPFTSTAGNQFSVRAIGGVRFVTGSSAMTLDGPFSTGGYVSAAGPIFAGGPISTFAGDIALNGGADYHHLELSGGNSTGYLYGSYPYFLDGVHLGYNFYADAAGSPHVINAGGGTSRITAGYGQVVLAVGKPGFGPNLVQLLATTNGVTVYGTFNNSSDRNEKQDIAPVSASDILEQVTQLPVSEWSYKEDPKTRHVGPMAQDFYSAFNIGTDDKHIAPMDEGGVALAAIQALNQKLEQKVEQKETEITELKRKNDSLEKRLAALEKIIRN
jgi:hypothetical protein